MDFARLFEKTENGDLQGLFGGDGDLEQFGRELSRWSEPLGKTTPSPVHGLDRIFRAGLAVVQKVVHFEKPPRPAKAEEEEDITIQSNLNESVAESGEPEMTVSVASESEQNRVLTRTAVVFRLWFTCVWKAARKNRMAALPMVFALPGTQNDGFLTEKDVAELLEAVRRFMDEKLELPKSHHEFVGALKELVLLLHEILHGVFGCARLVEKQASTPFVILKSILNCFYKVDLAGTVSLLLLQTWRSSDGGVDDIRLSYRTLMQIYVVFGSLAATPVLLLLVDKVLHSLDITNINDASPNVYSDFLMHLDFQDGPGMARLQSRFVPMLAAELNYYYGLQDDLVAHAENHLSFFSWITGHKFASNSYLGTPLVTDFESNAANLTCVDQDPLVDEIRMYEETARLNALTILDRDDEKAVSAPGFLNITLLLYSLVHNELFVDMLMYPEEKTAQSVRLLDLWLCVASYVLHYQYKCKINNYAGRLVLLILLKLTSGKNVLKFRKWRINEFKWKLCHHRHPPLPNDLGGLSVKTALLYTMDILQVLLRFNLTKKIDLDNAKLALTGVYQILAECEKDPVDNIGAYRWDELYKTLVHFLKFVRRNCNEENLKFVVEEVFLIFELVLSPAFDSVYEVSNDLWLTGSHVAKLMNYDLLFTLLHHLPALVEMFDRFVPKKDNFQRTQRCLGQLTAAFDLRENRERDLYEVHSKLQKINVNDEPAAHTRSAFNYVSTFKYLQDYADYSDFDKPAEMVDMFELLFDYVWVKH